VTATDETDAREVLEKIRAHEYAEAVTANLLAAVYEIQHDKQFENERGPVRAQLRDLIAAHVQEGS
jgi:hypothetical protein